MKVPQLREQGTACFENRLPKKCRLVYLHSVVCYCYKIRPTSREPSCECSFSASRSSRNLHVLHRPLPFARPRTCFRICHPLPPEFAPAWSYPPAGARTAAEQKRGQHGCWTFNNPATVTAARAGATAPQPPFLVLSP